jgi:hypothetical protein
MLALKKQSFCGVDFYGSSSGIEASILKIKQLVLDTVLSNDLYLGGFSLIPYSHLFSACQENGSHIIV